MKDRNRILLLASLLLLVSVGGVGNLMWQFPRIAQTQSLKGSFQFIILLGLFGTGLIFSILELVRQEIRNPILQLAGQLARLKERKTDGHRLDPTGSKDIDLLTHTLNDLLDGFEKDANVYRIFVETSPDIITLLDRDGCVLFGNANAARQWKCQPQEIIGKRQEELFPPDIAKRLKQVIREIFETGQPVYVDVHENIGEQHCWIDARMIPVLNEDGRVKAVLGISRDITERKKTEEALHLSRLSFHNVVARSEEGILIVDEEGIARFVNPAAQKLLGRKEDELLGSMLGFATVADGKSSEIEIVRINGEIGTGELRSVSTEWKGNAARLVTIRDVTEHKRTHDALQQSKQNFHNILEGSPDGMVIVDSNGLIVFANSTVTDVFGRPQEQLLGTSFGYPIISGQNTELDVVNTAGKSRVVEMRVVQTLWQGDPACLVSLRNITHRKHNEQQVILAHEELKRTNQSLVERNAEIRSFYHTLSHELKTPLTAACEFVSILMEGLAGPLNETQLEYLGIAKESCNQLRLHINDLLDVTRLETGKMSLDFQPRPVAPLVETVVKMLTPAAEGKGVSLSCDCQPDLPAVPFDKYRIQQVLTNLTTNAIKFTPAGGQIHISLSAFAADPECLQVTVRDTGCGISKDQLGLIFNRLHQAQRDDPMAESRSGLGLGLYICKELVQLHGGRIWAESELGQGSTFTFTIPKRQTPASLNVLVVDDEAPIRMVT